MSALPRQRQREVVIALLALDRYLLNGGKEAEETTRAYAALTKAYRGPSTELLEQFNTVCSAEEQGQWMAQIRIALEQEIDLVVWREVLECERKEKTTVEPQK